MLLLVGIGLTDFSVQIFIYSKTCAIQPSIIWIFNYPTSNPISQLHLNQSSYFIQSYYYLTYLLLPERVG